jgi:hypothetical protein
MGMTLIVGRRYRIKHIKGLLLDMAATFRWGEISMKVGGVSCFDNIVNINSRYRESPHVKAVLCNNEWSYHDSSSALIFKKIADRLAEDLPEDVVGIIEDLVLGPRPAGLGTYRYPVCNGATR